MKQRCGILDADGKQCSGSAVKKQALHLNPEFYGDIRWVAVPVCKTHTKLDGPPVVGGRTVR